MNEIDRYSIEFSKVYSRLMRLELLMKEKAFHAIFNYYGEASLITFEKFFNSRLAKYQTGSYNPLRELLFNKFESSKDLFKKLIWGLYFSDLLELILVYKQFAKPEITKDFYVEIPEKFGKIVKSRLLLRKLRNDIAHYNFVSYEENKKEYWDALFLFEKHMGHNLKGVAALPYFEQRPTISMILESILQLRPDLFNIDFKKSSQHIYHYAKERLLLEFFDQIALYNGYDARELPPPWSILRQMFIVKKNHKSLFVT